MPAGPSELGFAYFLAAKFAGYTAFCHWVAGPRIAALTGSESRLVPASTSPLGAALADSGNEAQSSTVPTIPSAAKAGVVRTLIGLAAGAMVGLGFWRIPPLANFDLATPVFFALLVPVRVGEWALLYWWIYKIHPFAEPAGRKLITFGILTSFALDFVGIVAAWVLPGGMWVC